MSPEVIQARTDQEQLVAARRTVEALDKGEVIILPTETVYGVAAQVTRREAMQRLRRIKGRRVGARPFSVHIGRKEDAPKYVNVLSPTAERLIRKAWPGPLALVLPVADPTKTQVADILDHDLLGEVFFNSTIGLRCPDHPMTARALVEVAGPVVAASANRPGNPPPFDAQAAMAELHDQVDLIVDAGITRYTKPSTIVRFAPDGTWHVLRSGVLDERAVSRLASTTILFVCSGNTCRSPIAEALCKLMLAEKLNVSPEKLAQAGYQVLSAGVDALAGSPASQKAIEAGRQAGVDLTGHRSRRLTSDLIRQADTIWTMCQRHRDEVIRRVPEAKEKARQLDPERQIHDPAGSDADEYAQCLRHIRAALEARLREMTS
jgi:L-threonylcarbamoyladenylate synthase